MISLPNILNKIKKEKSKAKSDPADLYLLNIAKLTLESSTDTKKFVKLCETSEDFWRKFVVKPGQVLDYKELKDFAWFLDNLQGPDWVKGTLVIYLINKFFCDFGQFHPSPIKN